MPPKQLAMLHIKANVKAFFLTAKHSAMRSTSGGIGKKDASKNDKMNNTRGP